MVPVMALMVAAAAAAAPARPNVLTMVPVMALMVVAAAAAAASARPNVLMIVSDDLRPAIGAYHGEDCSVSCHITHALFAQRASARIGEGTTHRARAHIAEYFQPFPVPVEVCVAFLAAQETWNANVNINLIAGSMGGCFWGR